MNDRMLRFTLSGGLFLVVFAVYVETMAGSASFWDCGEFIACAYSLGIPHPPATPLYVILGRVFTLLPLPLSIAQKVNLMSAFFGALGVVMLFWIVVELLRQQRGEIRTLLDRVVVYGCAAVAAFFTAWSNTYWTNAVEAEVYAISSFVMGLTTLLALRWSRNPNAPDGTRTLYLIIYLLSLCAGFHLGTVLVYPAIAAYFLLFRERRVEDADILIFSVGFFGFVFYVTLFKNDWFGGVALSVFLILAVFRFVNGQRFALTAGGLLFLGITVHLYLMIRSAQNPLIDEADPETFQNLLAVLRRDQYPPSNPLVRRATWEYQVFDHFGKYLKQQYELVAGDGFFAGWRSALVPLLIGVAGIASMARAALRNFMLFGGTLFITSAGMIVLLNFTDSEVRERDYFYSSAFYFFGVFIGVGAAAVLDWFFRGRRGEKPRLESSIGYIGGVAVLLTLTGFLYARYHFEHDRTRERVPWGYGYNMLAGLEPDSMIFTNGDNDTFPLWYQQEVENFRTDVRVVNLSLLNTTWYPKQLRDIEPKLHLNLTDEQIDNMGWAAWDHYRQTGEELQPRDLAVNHLLLDNLGKKPIYFAVTIPMETLSRYQNRLILEGVVYRFQGRKNPDTPDYGKIEQNVDTVYRFDGILDENGKHDYSIYRDPNQVVLVQNYAGNFVRLASRAEMLAQDAADDSTRQSLWLEAERRYLQALEISPELESVQVLLGNLYMRMGRIESAETRFQALVDADPRNDRALFELSQIHIANGRVAEGIAALQLLSSRNPDDEFLHQVLLEALWIDGRLEEAEQLVASWEARHPSTTRLRDHLNDLRDGLVPPLFAAPGGALVPPSDSLPAPPSDSL